MMHYVAVYGMNFQKISLMAQNDYGIKSNQSRTNKNVHSSLKNGKVKDPT